MRRPANPQQQISDLLETAIPIILTGREIWAAVCSVQRVGFVARTVKTSGALAAAGPVEIVRFAWMPPGWLRGSPQRAAYAQRIGQLVRHVLYAQVAARFGEVAGMPPTQQIRASMLTDSELRQHRAACPDDKVLAAEFERRLAVEEGGDRRATQIRIAPVWPNSPRCSHGNDRRWCIENPYQDDAQSYMCADIQIRTDLNLWPAPRRPSGGSYEK